MSKLKIHKRLNTRIYGRLHTSPTEYALRARKSKETQSQPEIINGYKVNRVIRWYEKNGDALIGETLLKGFSLTELQHVFDEPTDSSMFFSYQLTDEQASYFQHKLKFDFDLEMYEYFLECDAI
jgi:hypothetical protein